MANFVNLLDVIYPVDSVYVSMSSVSPATTIGGTWVQCAENAVLGQGTVPKNYEGSHTISIEQMPNHRHITNMVWIENTGDQQITRGSWVYRDSGYTTALPTWDTAGAGGGQDYTPYFLSCNIWYRTA